MDTPTEQSILTAIAQAAERIQAAQDAEAEATRERDELIRQAMGLETLRTGAIATAARLKAARLYQIRDRRR